MKPESSFRMIIFALLVALLSIFFGYQDALFNSFFQSFIEYKYKLFDPKLQENMKGTINFLYMFGGAVCCITGNLIYSKIGVYNSILLTIVTDTLICFIYLFDGFFMMYVARFMAGYFSAFGAIIGYIAIKQYLTEQTGNLMMNTIYIFLCLGILLSYGICIPENVTIWRFIYLFPLLFLIPIGIGIYFYFPENSLEIPGAKQPEKAELASMELRDSTHSEGRHEYLLETSVKEIDFRDLLTPEYKNQMSLALFLNIANQLGGINFLVLFSTDIYREVDLPNPPLLTFFMGFLNLAGGIFIMMVGNRISKRDLMYWGIIAQAAFLILFVLGLINSAGIFILIGSYMFVFSFSFSLGANLGPYLVDFVPPCGFSLIGIPQWITACLCGKYALSIMGFFGNVATFSFFAVFMIFSAIVFAKFSVTTEGKSPDSIKKEFMSKSLFN